MTHRTSRKWLPATVVVGLVAAALPLAIGPAAAQGDLDGDAIANARVSDAAIDRSTLSQVALEDVQVTRSTIDRASVQRASLLDVHVQDAALRDVQVAQSRLERVGGSGVALGGDVTACHSRLNDRGYGDCALVGANGDVAARILQDAPATIRANQTFDVRIRVLGDAPGQLTLSLAPRFLPLASEVLAIEDVFDIVASTAVARVEAWQDGAMVAAANGTEALSGPFTQGEITLRVHVAPQVIDGSVLQLRVGTPGGMLTLAPTTLEVVATTLAFLPVEVQPFAPFEADAVARLVAVQPADDLGNVDRDIDVAMTRDVTAYRAPEEGYDASRSVALHGDSEFFSDEPIHYRQPTSDAAHHPLVLEFIVRQVNGVDMPFGGFPAHATHMVGMGPYETEVVMTARAVSADGLELTAGPEVIALTAVQEASRTITNQFGTFEFPGRGVVAGAFIDGEGRPVAATEEQPIRVTFHETPHSHDIQVTRTFTEGEGYGQVLPSTGQAGLPFGNFVPNEYRITAERDGVSDAAHDGALVAVPAGGHTGGHNLQVR